MPDDIYITKEACLDRRGGITANYALEKSYKIEAVRAITPLKRVSSEDQNRQSGQNPSKPFETILFSKVLDKACEQERAKTIHVRTNGYTKDALPCHILINMREYA